MSDRRLRQVQRKVNINNTANRRITRAMAVYVTSLCASSEEREGDWANEQRGRRFIYDKEAEIDPRRGEQPAGC